MAPPWSHLAPEQGPSSCADGLLGRDNALSRIDYATHLWMEKEVKSVANVTRRDIREVLDLAARIPIRPEVEEFPLEAANEALLELKMRRIRGAKILRIAGC